MPGSFTLPQVYRFYPTIGPLHTGFTQSLNITSLLLQLVKPFGGKEPSELNIVPDWCFGDKKRFASFAEQSTLQPASNRSVDDVTRRNVERYGTENVNAIFDDKEQVYSTLFWLTNWSMRQGKSIFCHPNFYHFKFFVILNFRTASNYESDELSNARYVTPVVRRD